MSKNKKKYKKTAKEGINFNSGYPSSITL